MEEERQTCGLSVCGAETSGCRVHRRRLPARAWRDGAFRVSGTGCRKPRAWLVCTITVDNSQVWSSLNVHSQETTSSQLKKQQTHPRSLPATWCR